jgi:hypothetical protein
MRSPWFLKESGVLLAYFRMKSPKYGILSLNANSRRGSVMTTLWEFLTRHWLSVILILGVIVAVYFVYKHKDEIMIGGDNDK